MATRSGEDTERSELDSHADTTVGGSNCVLLCAGNETATVHSFSEELKPFKNVPIGTIATAWVDPKTAETFILEFPESLYFGDRLCHSLICPNQLRSNGVVVNDVPRQFDGRSTHSIVVPGDDSGIEIPLEMNGVISYFASHRPTGEELNSLPLPILYNNRLRQSNGTCRKTTLRNLTTIMTAEGLTFVLIMLILAWFQCLQNCWMMGNWWSE